MSIGSWGWDCHECGMSVQSCPEIGQLINLTDAHRCCIEEEEE